MAEDKILKALEGILGPDNVTNDPVKMAVYSVDQNPFGGSRTPAYLAMPETVEEIQEILRFCNRDKVPVYTRGSGISTMGVSNWPGVIMLDLYPRMNKVHEIDTEHRYAVIEPGVSAGELYRETEKVGLRPLTGQFPYTTSLISNYIETSAASEGARVAEQTLLLGLEVVLPTGETFRTGSWGVAGCRPLSPSNFGPNLTGLYFGSRGTLGVITKASIKLFPVPEYIDWVMIDFGDRMEDMMACEHEIFRRVKPAIHFCLDRGFTYFGVAMTMRMLMGTEAYMDSILPEIRDVFLDMAPPWLGLYVFEGTERAVKAQLDDLDTVVAKHKFEAMPTSAFGENFQAMLELFGTEQISKPGWMEILAYGAARCIGLNWAYGPASALPEMYERLVELAEEYSLPSHGFLFTPGPEDRIWGYQYLVGYDSSKPDEVRRIHDWYYELVKMLHRVGCCPPRLFFPPADSVTNYWLSQAPEYMEVVHRIKRALDPNDILNPGELQIVDPETFERRGI